MKKYLMIPCVLLLTGCATTAVPVAPKFPTAPDILMEECEGLMRLESGAKLSNVMITITENYMRYHECARKNKAWAEWYKEQKALFEKATDQK